ncbi:MAG: hypothetical protein HFI87_07060, partial [Bacilli bacterium]|nr:hypothetical protein [Bacilli bacterium]
VALCEGRHLDRIVDDEGKAEEKLDIAKNMLTENIDINLVSKITGLAKNQIELLK